MNNEYKPIIYADSSRDMEIPFPDSEIIYNDEFDTNTHDLFCDFETLKKFYENIDIVEIFEDEIIITINEKTAKSIVLKMRRVGG